MNLSLVTPAGMFTVHPAACFPNIGITSCLWENKPKMAWLLRALLCLVLNPTFSHVKLKTFPPSLELAGTPMCHPTEVPGTQQIFNKGILVSKTDSVAPVIGPTSPCQESIQTTRPQLPGWPGTAVLENSHRAGDSAVSSGECSSPYRAIWRCCNCTCNSATEDFIYFT